MSLLMFRYNPSYDVVVVLICNISTVLLVAAAVAQFAWGLFIFCPACVIKLYADDVLFLFFLTKKIKTESLLPRHFQSFFRMLMYS